MLKLTVTYQGKTESFECETRTDVAGVLDQYGVPIRFATGNRVVARGVTAEWSEVAEEVTKESLDARGWGANMARLGEIVGYIAPLPFWQNTGASVQSKNTLRALLAQHRGTELAELVRYYLNGLREDGAMIQRTDVEPYIRALRSQHNR